MKAPRCSFYFDLISKRQKGIVAVFLRGLLTSLSWLFGLGVYARKILYKTPFRPKAFTISIGNIVAGGTGKTPFAIFLAQHLLQHHSVGVLLRGYKAQIEHAAQSHVFQKEASVELVGDEALLIAKSVPEAWLFCGKNKVASAKKADEMAIQMIVVDDGMQHLGLARDIEIVMLDSLNPFGYGHLLPRGLLREPVSSLKRADLIVVTCRTGIDIAPSIQEVISSHTKAPICKVRYAPTGFYDLANRSQALEAGTKVGIFCAIAKPDQFVASIAACGLDVVHCAFLDDHEPFSLESLQKIAQKAKASGATCLVCTEKDMVKLSAALAISLPICCLKVGVEVMTPDVWQKFLAERLAR